MSTRDELLAEIEAFLAEFEVNASAFGTATMNDGKFVPRLRKGAGLTLDSADRIRSYMIEERKRLRARPIRAAAERAERAERKRLRGRPRRAGARAAA